MEESVQNKKILGDWQGKIDSKGIKLDVIFHITEDEGKFTSTIYIPIQEPTGFVMNKTEIDGDNISISSTQIEISFNGKFLNDQIIGEFHQDGRSAALTLTNSINNLPGDTSLPSSKEDIDRLKEYDHVDNKYSVKDFFAKPKASGFQLSPNGKYLSYREKDQNNKRHIYVKDLITEKVNIVVKEEDELIRAYAWKNSERIVFMMDSGGDENYHIYAVNIDGTNLKDLTPFDKTTVSVENFLKDQKDFIIITMNKNNEQVFEPFKLNVVTGELEQLFVNSDSINPIISYWSVKGICKIIRWR